MPIIYYLVTQRVVTLPVSNNSVCTLFFFAILLAVVLFLAYAELILD